MGAFKPEFALNFARGPGTGEYDSSTMVAVFCWHKTWYAAPQQLRYYFLPYGRETHDRITTAFPNIENILPFHHLMENSVWYFVIDR